MLSFWLMPQQAKVGLVGRRLNRKWKATVPDESFEKNIDDRVVGQPKVLGYDTRLTYEIIVYDVRGLFGFVIRDISLTILGMHHYI